MPIKEQQVRKFLPTPLWVLLTYTFVYPPNSLTPPLYSLQFLVSLLELCGRLVSFITLIHTHTTKLYMYCHRFFLLMKYLCCGQPIFCHFSVSSFLFVSVGVHYYYNYYYYYYYYYQILKASVSVCVCVLTRVYVRCVSLLYRIDYIKKNRFRVEFYFAQHKNI